MAQDSWREISKSRKTSWPYANTGR